MRTCLAEIILCFCLATNGLSQPTERISKERIPAVQDFSSLMLAADYASNTNLMGVFSTAVKQPSWSPSLSYYSKWGADISALAFFIDNSDDSLENFSAELDLLAGYTWHPAENLSVNPGYAHYFHSSNSNALKSMFTDEIRLQMDYTPGIFNAGVSAGYYMGSQHTFYASLHNYYSVYVDRFLFRNGSLGIQPGLDVNFGSYEYLNLYYIDKLREDPSIYLYLLSYPAIRRYVLYEKARNPDLTYQDILDTYLEDQAQDSFKLTSLTISLPVYFLMGDFAVNLGLYTIIPFGQPDYMTDEVQFFFDIGVSYNFMLR